MKVLLLLAFAAIGKVYLLVRLETRLKVHVKKQ
jgi:hypothetical protein